MKKKTGYEFREYRKQLGLSQGDVSKLLKCTKKDLQNVEYKHMKRPIPKWMVERIVQCDELNEFIIGPRPKKKPTLWSRILRISENKNYDEDNCSNNARHLHLFIIDLIKKDAK